MQESQDLRTFQTVFYYCFLVIALPISTFFGTKVFILDGVFGASATTSNVWSAIFAVIALHVALGLFIFKAYSDPGKIKPGKLD